MSIQLPVLKLSIQRALLGNISPKLRAVCANVEENKIYINFYYDGIISEDDQELYEHACAQIMADFSFPEKGSDVETECNMQIIRLDFPQKMPLIGHWVYYRNEE